MSRSERFFFWLGRINAVGIFLLLLFAAGTIAIGFLQGYRYRQELEDEKFGNEVTHSGPYSGDSIEVPGGEIAAYYEREGDTFERREGSDVTLVDPRTGKTRRIAGDDDDAWVLNWELIFRAARKVGRPSAISPASPTKSAIPPGGSTSSWATSRRSTRRSWPAT